MRTLILSTSLYACESWTLTAEIERRIQTLEMRCYRRLLNISYKDHLTNEELRNRMQNAIRVHDDLLTMVKKRKLRWYGHISRSSGMSKTILQGTLKGARSRGRQKKRWEDNIKEWTGMGFGDTLRAAEGREGWKGIVANVNAICGAPTTSEVKGLRWDEYRKLQNYIVTQSKKKRKKKKKKVKEKKMDKLFSTNDFKLFRYFWFYIVYDTRVNNWAATRQNQQNGCAPSEDRSAWA